MTKHISLADLLSGDQMCSHQEQISAEHELENPTLMDRKWGKEEFLKETSIPVE